MDLDRHYVISIGPIVGNIKIFMVLYFLHQLSNEKKLLLDQ